MQYRNPFASPPCRLFALMFGLLTGFAVRAAAPDTIEQTLNMAIDQSWAHYSLGIQVGLWVPGQGEWTIAKGLSDVERNKPMKVGMQQPIGSITKTMTGTLILQLVEEGKLSLDDRLSKWYPSAGYEAQLSGAERRLASSLCTTVSGVECGAVSTDKLGHLPSLGCGGCCQYT